MIFSKRVVALDVMRGLTISLMILVNNPGNWDYVYAPLRHSKWNGCTPTDLVFPFFLFIVGVSMWFSFKKYGRGITKAGLYKVIKRTLIIFLLGLFLNLFPYFNFENVRILGVLQRIALAYGFAAILTMQFTIKQLRYIFASILIGYWLLLLFGGNGHNPFAEQNNLVYKFDLFVLGENHMYKGLGFTFDPEGLLSTIPSIATILLGYFAGKIIEYSRSIKSSIKTLLTNGVILIFIGWIWGFIFPINKSLWTSSYVLYTGGLAIVFLTFLLWIIDVKGIKKWANPFIHFGTNPLFIYMFSELYVLILVYLVTIIDPSGEKMNGYDFLYQKVFQPIAGNMNGSLLFAIIHILVFWFITYILYKKKIFIKI